MEASQKDGEALIHTAPSSLFEGISARLELVDSYREAQPTEKLLQAMQDDRWEVRMAAVHSLGERRDPAHLDVLLMALEDEHRQVRAAAIRALGKLEQDVPLTHFVLALQDRAWEVREMAVWTLAEMKGQDVRPLLLSALHDTHTPVQEAAKDALAQYDVLVQKRNIVAGEIELQPELQGTGVQGVRQRLGHLWLIVNHQFFLLQRQRRVPAIVLFLSYMLILFTTIRFDSSPQHTGSALVLTAVSMLSSALAIAFTIDARYDDGFEVTLSTPTSLRTIMLSRFTIVIGANILLASSASLVMALFYGLGWSDIVQLWLGPLVLVSSFTLALTLLLGSSLSFVLIVVFEVVQTQLLSGQEQLQRMPVQLINPALLICLVMLCLTFAFFYAPRRAQLY